MRLFNIEMFTEACLDSWQGQLCIADLICLAFALFCFALPHFLSGATSLDIVIRNGHPWVQGSSN